MKSTFYVIRHKDGRYLVPFRRSNEGRDFCNEVTVELHAENVEPLKAWRAESGEQAQHTIQFPPPWYNAGETTPTHSYEPLDLVVEEIRLEATIVPIVVKIPTVEEYLKESFGPDSLREPNPGHLEYCLRQLAAGLFKSYSWHDYQWLRMQQETTRRKRAKNAVRTSANREG